MFLDLDAAWGPPPAYGPPAISLSDNYDVSVLVDEIDHAWALRWKWSMMHSAGKIVERAAFMGKATRDKADRIYARRTVMVWGRKSNIWLHREICQRAHGPPPSPAHVGDHWNGDSLDCRRKNLRWATLSQNARNLFGSAWLQLRMDV